MKLLRLDTTDPYLNLAIEEYLFRTIDDDVIILWQNRPTVVIGKNQNAYAEVNIEKTESKNITIARRITGGGAVYHDLGNLNYSYISVKGSSGIDFKTFTSPIIDALSSFGVNAELSGRNDLTVNGKKFSGNAQHTEEGRVLHHGTLLFSSDLSVLSEVLKVDELKIRTKAIKSTRARVINLSELIPNVSIDAFADKLYDYFVSAYSPKTITPPSFEEVESLYLKNSSEEWIFPKKDLASKYETTFAKRFDFGTVRIELSMQDKIIENARIRGDFFGNGDVKELENLLSGASLIEARAILSNIDISQYILGMTTDEFLGMIN